MKSHFSRVVALGVLFCAAPSWAQTPNAGFTADSAAFNPSVDAIAYIGAFYNKVSQAKSHRGRILITETTFTGSKHVYEIQSNWKVEEGKNKFFDELDYTVSKADKMTAKAKYRMVSDGINLFQFDAIKNIWSENRPAGHNGRSTWFEQSERAWEDVLNWLIMGRTFYIDRKVVDGKEQVWITGSPSIKGSKENNLKKDEYVFDSKSGNLLRWTYQGAMGSKRECLWIGCEYDVPLPSSIFHWTKPEGATKIDTDEIDTLFSL